MVEKQCASVWAGLDCKKPEGHDWLHEHGKTRWTTAQQHGPIETRSADALPEAAWFATEIMEWHTGVHRPDKFPNDTPCWMDALGTCQAHLRATSSSSGWNPLANDADALYLWRQMPNPKELRYWAQNVFAYIYLPKKLHQASGWGRTDRDAICHAVHDWWMAQREEEAHG